MGYDSTSTVQYIRGNPERFLLMTIHFYQFLQYWTIRYYWQSRRIARKFQTIKNSIRLESFRWAG
jgi:hypothetical protein